MSGTPQYSSLPWHARRDPTGSVHGPATTSAPRRDRGDDTAPGRDQQPGAGPQRHPHRAPSGSRGPSEGRAAAPIGATAAAASTSVDLLERSDDATDASTAPSSNGHRLGFGRGRRHPSSRDRRRPWWRSGRMFSLALIAVLAVPLITASKSVALTVDGETRTTRTYAATVGELLTDLDVELAAADAVHPPRATALADGADIRVTRAIAVDVVVDDEPARRVVAPASSVAGVLHAAGLDDLRDQGAAIVPDVHAAIGDGDTITVRTPRDFSITVDGDTVAGTTLVSTVGLLLEEQGVEVSADDLVSPSQGAVIDGPAHVTITRVTFEEEVEDVVLEYGESTRETDELYEGQSRVAQEGADGVREDTYRIELHDGEQVGRELVSEEVVDEPVEHIVEAGTRERPPPEPEPEPETEVAASSVSSSSSGSSSSSSSSSAPAVASGSVWDRLAQCESGGNWSINTGNGYYGGLQFSLSTWRAVGGSGYPHEASRAEQINRGQILQQRSGWGQWPACSSKLGLR